MAKLPFGQILVAFIAFAGTDPSSSIFNMPLSVELQSPAILVWFYFENNNQGTGITSTF